MKFSLIVSLALVAGGLAFLTARRRRVRADAALWAEATDRVVPGPRHAG